MALKPRMGVCTLSTLVRRCRHRTDCRQSRCPHCRRAVHEQTQATRALVCRRPPVGRQGRRQLFHAGVLSGAARAPAAHRPDVHGAAQAPVTHRPDVLGAARAPAARRPDVLGAARAPVDLLSSRRSCSPCCPQEAPAATILLVGFL
jgi:hypothetical protein